MSEAEKEREAALAVCRHGDPRCIEDIVYLTNQDEMTQDSQRQADAKTDEDLVAEIAAAIESAIEGAGSTTCQSLAREILGVLRD